MFRGLGLAAAAALALAAVPGALAAFPSPMATQGRALPSKDGALRFVARGSAGHTIVTAERPDGSVARSATVPGSFGIPILTANGPTGGLFRDGSAFVLQSMGYRATSAFRVVRTEDLGVRSSISLAGTFAFDALSPDGSKLYLIQHTSAQDIRRYVVRAYDLRAHRLLPGTIADKTQKGWVMQGFPATRTSTADGRWVYTLYSNPGGYPFVHALDTVRGVAHCVGIAWKGADQGPIFEYALAVRGQKLLVTTGSGTVYRVIDRRNWRVTRR